MSILDTVNINRDIDDISMNRGDTLAYPFMIQGSDGSAAVDNARFRVKADKNATGTVFELTLGNGITNEGDGIYIVRAKPELTANLEPNTYYYTLKIFYGNDAYTVMQGKLIIKKGEQ